MKMLCTRLKMELIKSTSLPWGADRFGAWKFWKHFHRLEMLAGPHAVSWGTCLSNRWLGATSVVVAVFSEGGYMKYCSTDENTNLLTMRNGCWFTWLLEVVQAKLFSRHIGACSPTHDFHDYCSGKLSWNSSWNVTGIASSWSDIWCRGVSISYCKRGWTSRLNKFMVIVTYPQVSAFAAVNHVKQQKNDVL